MTTPGPDEDDATEPDDGDGGEWAEADALLLGQPTRLGEPGGS